MKQLLEIIRGTGTFLLVGLVISGGAVYLSWYIAEGRKKIPVQPAPDEVLTKASESTKKGPSDENERALAAEAPVSNTEKKSALKEEQEIEMPEAGKPADTTLLGYDISLPMQTFKTVYAKQIKNCEKELYPSNLDIMDEGLIDSPQVAITNCELKKGISSYVQFFDEKILSLKVEANPNNFWLRAAVEAMKEKTASEPQITFWLFRGGDIHHANYWPNRCGAQFQFVTGVVTVLSENEYPRLKGAWESGGKLAVLSACKGWGMENLKWGSTHFHNLKVQQSLDDKLKTLKESALKEEAKKVKF